MWRTSCVVLFLLLHGTGVFCHDAQRLNSLDTKFKGKISRLRMDLLEELSDREEKIKSDIRFDLPEIIEQTILDLLSSGELDKLWKVNHDNGLNKLHRQIQHLKTVVLGLTRGLAERNEALVSVRQEIQKLRSDKTLQDQAGSKTDDNDITSVRREMLKLRNDMNVVKEMISETEESEIISVRREVLKLQNDMNTMDETSKTRDSEIRREISKLRNDVTIMNDTISKTEPCQENEIVKESPSVSFSTEKQHVESTSKTIVALGKNGQCLTLNSSNHDERRLFEIPINVQAFTALKDKTSLTLVVSGGNSYLKKMRFITRGSSVQLDENIDFEPRVGGTCYSMAFDDRKKSIFFGVSTYEPRHKIHRTVRHRIHEVADVTKYGHTAYSLALDPVQEVLYSCHFVQLVRLSYNGRNEKVIASGTFLLGVTLGPSADDVYYSDGGAIMRVSPDGDGKRLMRTLKHSMNIRSIVFADDKIYAGDFAGDVIMYDLTLNASHTIATLPTSYVVLTSLT